MTNREKLRARLQQGVSRDLQNELNHWMEIDRDPPEEGEQPYDVADAFLDVENLSDTEKAYVEYRAECRRILIDVGYYRIMPQKEIDDTIVTSGTKWAFKLKGVAYTQDQAISGFS